MPGHRRKAALVVVLRLVLLSGEVPAEFEEIIDRDGPVAETYISDIVAARSAAHRIDRLAAPSAIEFTDREIICGKTSCGRVDFPVRENNDGKTG